MATAPAGDERVTQEIITPILNKFTALDHGKVVPEAREAPCAPYPGKVADVSPHQSSYCLRILH